MKDKINLIVPDFKCNTCGNCEKKFNEIILNTPEVAFCVRFVQTVGLHEKNVGCWTDKKHDYFTALGDFKTKEKLKAYHINEKRKQKLELNFDNQLTLF